MENTGSQKPEETSSKPGFTLIILYFNTLSSISHLRKKCWKKKINYFRKTMRSVLLSHESKHKHFFSFEERVKQNNRPSPKNKKKKKFTADETNDKTISSIKKNNKIEITMEKNKPTIEAKNNAVEITKPKKRRLNDENTDKNDKELEIIENTQESEKMEEDKEEFFDFILSDEQWELKITIKDPKYKNFEVLLNEFNTFKSLDKLNSYIDLNIDKAYLIFYAYEDFAIAAGTQINWGEISKSFKTEEQVYNKRDKDLKYKTFFTFPLEEWNQSAKEFANKMEFKDAEINRVENLTPHEKNVLVCIHLPDVTEFKKVFNYRKILRANHQVIPKLSYFLTYDINTTKVFYNTRRRIPLDKLQELKIEGFLGASPFIEKLSNRQKNCGWAYVKGTKAEWNGKKIDLPDRNFIEFFPQEISQRKKRKRNFQNKESSWTPKTNK